MSINWKMSFYQLHRSHYQQIDDRWIKTAIHDHVTASKAILRNSIFHKKKQEKNKQAVVKINESVWIELKIKNLFLCFCPTYFFIYLPFTTFSLCVCVSRLTRNRSCPSAAAAAAAVGVGEWCHGTALVKGLSVLKVASVLLEFLVVIGGIVCSSSNSNWSRSTIASIELLICRLWSTRLSWLQTVCFSWWWWWWLWWWW